MGVMKSLRAPLERLYRDQQAGRSLVRRAHAAAIQSPALTRLLFGVGVDRVETEGYFDLTTILLKQVVGERLRRNPDLRLLEIGAGGFAVLSGALSRRARHPIDACELDGKRVELARRHIEKNHLAVHVFQSDLFASVPERRYDLIFWNLPYWAPSERYLPGLFSGAPAHLAPGGELVIGYNGRTLPRADVLGQLERSPMRLDTVVTWWWNLHEVLIAR